MKFKLFSVVALGIVTAFSTVPSVYADSANAPFSDKFEKYRQEIIQDEIALSATDTIGTLSRSETEDTNLQNRISKLENAEIVELTFNEEGTLVTADSSEEGEVTKRFVNDVVPPAVDSEDQSFFTTQSAVSNPSTPPSGAGSGAFHRIQTPRSTSLANSYTGLVADSITLPNYNVAAALDTSNGQKTEGAYLYTGIDPGLAEVGMIATRQNTYNMAAGWYPVFHAAKTHKVNDGNINGQPGGQQAAAYYYDSAHRYSNGATINGYKVYYKYDESQLSIRYILGTQIYQVNFPGENSQGKSVKRLTTIAMNGMNGNTSQKFRVPFSTAAIWNNTRFLYNNGTQTKTPEQVVGLITNTWNHGGTLDYTKSGTLESIRIY